MGNIHMTLEDMEVNELLLAQSRQVASGVEQSAFEGTRGQNRQSRHSATGSSLASLHFLWSSHIVAGDDGPSTFEGPRG